MAVSFSGSAKAEICRGLPSKKCCALAQCFGVLLFANSFTRDNVRIITESKEFARLLPGLFKKAFGLACLKMEQAESSYFNLFKGRKLIRL